MFGVLSVFGRCIKGMIRLRPEQVWTCNVTRHHRLLLSPSGSRNKLGTPRCNTRCYALSRSGRTTWHVTTVCSSHLLAPVTNWEPHGATLAVMPRGMGWKFISYLCIMSVTCNVMALQYVVMLQVCTHLNIQQLYALSTLYLCVLYLSENKQ
jgi:hypothetical protein